MTEMRAEVARGEGNKSPNTQSERSSPGSCVYVSLEQQTLPIECRPRVRRNLLPTLFIISMGCLLCYNATSSIHNFNYSNFDYFTNSFICIDDRSDYHRS